MQHDTVTVRNMNQTELEQVLGWAADEGWNPGSHDADAFFAGDPQGFFLAEAEGEAIGALSAVRYGADFGFLGLYIVKPEWRGQGHGMRLWQTGMAHLAGRCVGLDGVVERQDDYRRSGFNYAYRTVRYRCHGLGPGGAAGNVVDVLTLPEAALLDYDRALFPAPRQAFLARWLRQPEAGALAVVGNNGLQGYGMIRKTRDGWRLGPWFADSPEYAECLLQALRQRAPSGDAVLVDIPEPNTVAMAMAAQQNMEPVFESARMYAGAAPQLPLQRIYGVTSLELG